MQGIASWAEVEYFLLASYVAMFGGTSDLAAKMFLSMDTRGSKADALAVLGREKLSTKQQAALTDLLKLAKRRGGARDKLAHWIWGMSEELPDALLLLDPRCKVQVSGHSDLSPHIFVYREPDLRKIIRDNEALARIGSNFARLIETGGDDLAQQLSAQLAKELAS